MAVIQSVKDLQVIEGGKNPHAPDHSQESSDWTSAYTPDHSPENPSVSSVPADCLWAVGELADRFDCSDRTIQKMMKFVKEAYPTAKLKDRQGKRLMYTSLCVQYLDSLHQFKERGIDSPQWVQSQKESPQSPSVSAQEENPPISVPSPVSASEAEYRECAIVLHEGMHIDVPCQSKSDQVRAALAIRRSEKPAIAPPSLNGQADSLLSDALLLNQVVDAFQSKIEQQEHQLQQRFESVEDARELIALNVERIQELDDREQKLISVGLELSELEQQERSTLQSQLKKLLKNREESQS